jgi:hypothetical protein
MQLQRETGIKFSKRVGLFVIGIISNNVVLKSTNIFLEVLETPITLQRSSLTKSKQPKKNSTRRPSNLRILSFWKLWRVQRSSSFPTIAISSWISSRLTKIGKKLANLMNTTMVTLDSYLKTK